MDAEKVRPSCRGSERGIAMVALLVALAAMSIMFSVALPAWQTAVRREKEAELVFRGEQYARAIGAYQRKTGNVSPPTVDVLVSERLLRKKYLDPITDAEFEYLTAGSAIQGSATANTPLGRAAAASAQGRAGGLSLTQTTTIATAAGGRGAQPQTTVGRVSAQGARGGVQIQSSFSVASATGGATTGIIGVRSKSKEKSFRVYNGAETYDQWIFLATQVATALSAPAAGLAPGATGGRGQPAGRGAQAPGAGGRAQPQGVRGRGDTAPAPQRGGAPARGGAGGGFGGGGFGGGGGRGF